MIDHQLTEANVFASTHPEGTHDDDEYLNMLRTIRDRVAAPIREGHDRGKVLADKPSADFDPV